MLWKLLNYVFNKIKFLSDTSVNLFLQRAILTRLSQRQKKALKAITDSKFHNNHSKLIKPKHSYGKTAMQWLPLFTPKPIEQWLT